MNRFPERELSRAPRWMVAAALLTFCVTIRAAEPAPVHATGSPVRGDDVRGFFDETTFAVEQPLSCDATCQAGFVTEHNRVRTRVNSGLMPAPAGTFQPIPAPLMSPLAWDATIASGAQTWADGCSHTHSGAAGLGENLYYSAGSVPTPADAVASWESESTAYTYAAIGDPVNTFSDIGHYTQLVWANTTQIGCGVTHCTTNTPFPGFPEWDFIVCRYSPPGNFTGQFPYAAAIVCSGNAACDDGNVCTDDVCINPGTPASRCTHTNNTAACNDGNACTGPDTCGPPPSCGASQNFDAVAAPALPSGWTSSVTGTGSLWTTVSASSDTAPNSALGANGAVVSDEVLVSPPIAITSASATLTFKTRWSFEDSTNCYDAGVLEIKIGAGAFTDIVSAGASFVSGGYTGTVASSFSNPLGGRSAWCNNSPGYPAYVAESLNLPAAAAGQSIQLRWRIGTDTTNGAAGWNVDSIVIGDVCTAVCVGGPAVGAPLEVQNVAAAADKATYSWSAVAGATRYDVVRGGTNAFPVGPGGGDETCFDNLAGTTVVDAALPAAGGGFWYLSRGENACINGTFGTQTNGSPRTTTTCP
jgi:Cysteine-rich secretory protein family